MSKLDSIFTNLTNSHLELTFHHKSSDARAKFELGPKETCNLVVFETPYDIVILTVNGKQYNLRFETVISSYMGIIKGLDTSELYLQDFVNNKKIIGTKSSFLEPLNLIVSTGNRFNNIPNPIQQQEVNIGNFLLDIIYYLKYVLN